MEVNLLHLYDHIEEKDSLDLKGWPGLIIVHVNDFSVTELKVGYNGNFDPFKSEVIYDLQDGDFIEHKVKAKMQDKNGDYIDYGPMTGKDFFFTKYFIVVDTEQRHKVETYDKETITKKIKPFMLQYFRRWLQTNHFTGLQIDKNHFQCPPRFAVTKVHDNGNWDIQFFPTKRTWEAHIEHRPNNDIWCFKINKYERPNLNTQLGLGCFLKKKETPKSSDEEFNEILEIIGKKE